MSDYRTIIRVRNNKLEIYRFDGCKEIMLWVLTEKYCLSKADFWIVNEAKIDRILRDYYTNDIPTKRQKNNVDKYKLWVTKLTQYKI